MATAIEDIADYLSASMGSAWVTTGTNPTIRTGKMPDTPDNVIVVFEQLAFEPPAETFGSNEGAANLPNIERPQLQIITRAAKNDYNRARTNAELAYRALHGTYNKTINGTVYKNIFARSTPHYQGEDDNSRHEITFTIDVWQTPPGLGTITGGVRNGSGNVSGATVVVEGTTLSTVSGVGGTYTLSNVPALTSLTVTATKAAETGSNTNVDVVANTTTPNIDLGIS